MLPGFTVTPMTDVVPDKIKERVCQTIPLGRMGSPEGKIKTSNNKQTETTTFTVLMLLLKRLSLHKFIRSLYTVVNSASDSYSVDAWWA